jgi:AcrR family transcriptional regulator
MTKTAARPRGRPPAASRDDVLGTALKQYLHGERVDVQAIAAELGVGRTTIYRWFGSRDKLLGEVLAAAADPLIEEARAKSRGAGGRALLDTFDRLNRGLADSPALLTSAPDEADLLRVGLPSAGPP